MSIQVRETTFVFRGWQSHRLALAAGHRATFNGVAGGWVLDLDKLADFQAYLERRNVAVEVTVHGGEQLCNALHSSQPEQLANALASSEQLDLFGGAS